MYLVAGMVARNIAGPGVIFSFIIAAVASIFSGEHYRDRKWPMRKLMILLLPRNLLCRIRCACPTYDRLCVLLLVCVGGGVCRLRYRLEHDSGVFNRHKCLCLCVIR